MKAIIKILVFAFLVAVVVSCEQTIFLDVPNTQSKLVLNGILDNRSGLWVNVSSTVRIYDQTTPRPTPVIHAAIDYYKDDQQISTISENSEGDYFESANKPEPGKKYKIVVRAAGFPQASTEMILPSPVKITDYTLDVKSGSIDPYVPQYIRNDINIKLTYNDPEETGNYYMLGIYYLKGGLLYPIEPISGTGIDASLYIKDGIAVLAWNDAGSNGQETKVDFNFVFESEGKINNRFYIFLYSIEKNYYNYLKTYSQNYTVLNGTSLIYEGVQVYSNIKGGYGIMAATSSSFITFDIKQ